LKVLMPYTNLHPEVTAALDASGYVWEPVDVSSDDEAYYRLLSEVLPGGACIVEHDVVVERDTLREMDACPEGWCSVPVWYYDGASYPGLGCARFRAGVVTPETMQRVGEMSDETHPPKQWCRLDAWLGGTLLSKSVRRHVHEGVLRHLRPEGEPMAPAHEPCRRLALGSL
jgi:hypothetical protein